LTTDAPIEGTPSQPPRAHTSAASARGWAGSDLAIGAGLIVLLIALFLPWFTETLQLHPGAAFTATENGPPAHGYLWLVFALAIVALVALIDRDAIERIPGNLPSAQQILLGASGLSLLLTLLGVVFRPPGFSGSGQAVPIQALQAPSMFSVGWSYGGFLAVVAAAVAFAGALGIAGHLPVGNGPARAQGRWPKWRRSRTDG
jgi:multisubunit Na+/H+ antiporter MnhB subunit